MGGVSIPGGAERGKDQSGGQKRWRGRFEEDRTGWFNWGRDVRPRVLIEKAS